MADLDDVVRELQEIKGILANDRQSMWRLLTVVIAGAFALIGLKIALP